MISEGVLRSRVSTLPPRVQELLRDLYEGEDWQVARLAVTSPAVRSRWASSNLARQHLQNLCRLGVLRLDPDWGGHMTTVPDEAVRRAVVDATRRRSA